MSEIDFETMARGIGPAGEGVSVVRGFIEPELLQSVQAELHQELPWRQQQSITNQYGRRVVQVFDSFAHKFSVGDQEKLEDLTAIVTLGQLVLKDVIKPLSQHFPSLVGWRIDECNAQRYPTQGGQLGWHRDHARHPGVVAVTNIEGKGKFRVRREVGERTYRLQPGDMVLLRAPRLYPNSGSTRPFHAVRTIGRQQRISLTFRDNVRPREPIPNMSYHNWQEG